MGADEGEEGVVGGFACFGTAEDEVVQSAVDGADGGVGAESFAAFLDHGGVEYGIAGLEVGGVVATFNLAAAVHHEDGHGNLLALFHQSALCRVDGS